MKLLAAERRRKTQPNNPPSILPGGRNSAQRVPQGLQIHVRIGSNDLAASSAADTAHSRGARVHDQALDLQRLAGNRATRSAIQPKLIVGSAGGAYEQEADRMASEVMRRFRDMELRGESQKPSPQSGVAANLASDRLGGIRRVDVPTRDQLLDSSVREEDEEQLAVRVPGLQLVPVVGQEGGPVDTDLEAQIEASRSGGKPITPGIRQQLEGVFDMDFSRVRVHVDERAHSLSEQLQAIAFTSGADIFFGRGRYDVTSSSGKRLLAHELTHVVQQRASIGQVRRAMLDSEPLQRNKKGGAAGAGTAGPTTYVAAASGTGRQLEWITMKRKHIHLFGDDKYGHWWTEIGVPPSTTAGGESYGWWPAEPLGLWTTLTGVKGDLNGQALFAGSSLLDPHHGDAAEEEFHPRTQNADPDATIYANALSFVAGYSGEWRWTLGWGQNCHTFQEGLMAAAHLRR